MYASLLTQKDEAHREIVTRLMQQLAVSQQQQQQQQQQQGPVASINVPSMPPIDGLLSPVAPPAARSASSYHARAIQQSEHEQSLARRQQRNVAFDNARRR